MEFTSLFGAVALSHLFLRERIRPGDRVVDATCGNGHDTLLLARLVGDSGKVWGFDLQEQALAATRELLSGEGVLHRVELVAAGHERLAEFITEPLRAVVFNLGYLPGGDRQVITVPATTVPALTAAAALLAPGGILVIVVYTGHAGGAEEDEAVRVWAAALDRKMFNVWDCRQLNRQPTAPYLLLVEKGGA
jgi:SAM-dependent methyltransferase